MRSASEIMLEALKQPLQDFVDLPWDRFYENPF
jgi:hypothetical protein